MNSYITLIEDFLKNLNNPFVIEQNKMFENGSTDLYAFRKAGMLGRDYFFIHDFSEMQIINTGYIISLHEAARKYVNCKYKMPKIMRLRVPNIVSFFISANGFSNESILYANKPTREYTGGEIHSVFLIDLRERTFYGQGKSVVRVDGLNFEFKKIDPQNRALGIANDIGNLLFN